MADRASTADSRFTADHRTANATASSVSAKTSAALGVTAPVTSGRFWVRGISLSMSRSMYMFTALAPPAARAPPTNVVAMSHRPGILPAATTMVGSVVMSSSSMMRGLVSARYAPAFDVGAFRRS